MPDVIHRDRHLMIVDKPSGLLTVPGRTPDRADCLISRVQREVPEALIVHRLDMDTSGLVILALSTDMQRELSRLFRERLIEKEYIAEIFGVPDQTSGTIDLPLICDWPNRPRQMVDFENGKHAVTHWKITGKTELGAKVRLTPETGRSHQLRVHMLSLGTPILGDNLYHRGGSDQASDRLRLHASRLQFDHPVTGERLNIEGSEAGW